jgi:hypothetical protein
MTMYTTTFLAGLFMGLTAGGGALLVYRGLLRYKATPNLKQPETIGGKDYWIIPDEEYQNYLFCVDMVRASLGRLRSDGRPLGASPYLERRHLKRPFEVERRGVPSSIARFKPRPDHDQTVTGAPLKPGS